MAKERDARNAGQTEAAKGAVRSIDEAGSTVETTDEDVAIYGDAEGTGSQGRSDMSQEPEEDETDGADTEQGVTRDDQGQLHLDLEA